MGGDCNQMNQTQRTLIQQAREQGVRMQAVTWNNNAVKFHTGERGVIVSYNRVTDLYDLNSYKRFDILETLDGVFVDQLGGVIRSMMRKRVVS